MSLSNPEKKIAKICYSLQVFHNTKEKYVYLHPTDIADIKYSCQSNDHSGWMLCDGRSLSRTEYSDLFEAIGTAFGNNDSNTFKLPDARGRVLGAIGTGSGLTPRSLGDTVGTETHTLTSNEMPSHNHTINDPGHTHSYVANTNDQDVNNLTTQETAADNADLGATTGSSNTGITINNTGGGQAHNNMQPTEFIGNVFIFAKYPVYP